MKNHKVMFTLSRMLNSGDPFPVNVLHAPNSKKVVSELLHCALLHTQTAMHHVCNEFVHCCMTRPQNIVVHIASMANTRMSLSHSRYLQCYLKNRYNHGALRSGFATTCNAQCNNSEDNFFLIRCIHKWS